MEVLLRVIDKDQPDPLLSPISPKAGDVVVVKPDSWPWSVAERTNPEWRIIRVPFIATDSDALTSSLSMTRLGPKRRRDWMIDTSLLPLPGRFTGPRLAEIISLTRLAVVAAIVRKAN
jgi:hypothetical protein